MADDGNGHDPVLAGQVFSVRSIIIALLWYVLHNTHYSIIYLKCDCQAQSICYLHVGLALLYMIHWAWRHWILELTWVFINCSSRLRMTIVHGVKFKVALPWKVLFLLIVIIFFVIIHLLSVDRRIPLNSSIFTWRNGIRQSTDHFPEKKMSSNMKKNTFTAFRMWVMTASS